MSIQVGKYNHISSESKKATLSDLKKLAKQTLIKSKKQSLKFYLEKLIPKRNALFKVEDKIEELCEELRYYGYKEDSEDYKKLDAIFQEEWVKKMTLEASIEDLQKLYLKIRDEKKTYLLVFPDLEMEVAREVASFFEKKKSKLWYNSIERRRQEIYNMDPWDQYEYEEQCHELECLDKEESELDDHLIDYYNDCLNLLLEDKVSNRRSHLLLITPM